MIARTWTARTDKNGADVYVEFFRETIVPQLARIEGHRGALVLDREEGGKVEITVLTFWDSMEAISRFAGDPIDESVVEPQARAVLKDFDLLTRHNRVRIDAR